MKTITLRLTLPQACGLEAFAAEGREGLMTDKDAARSFIGTKAQQDAAIRAHELLVKAIASAVAEVLTTEEGGE